MSEQYDAAVGQLMKMIGSGSLGGDGRLPPERTLALQLGVSRRTIRRALDQLAGEGRIRRRQGSGTFVGVPGKISASPFREAAEQTNPVEVMEVRLALEPTLARLAALRASRCDIDKLLELAEATRNAATPEEYEQIDAEFHRGIAVAARNALSVAVFDAVIAAIEDASWHGVRENAHCSKNKEIYSNFHRDIAKAIAARNFDRAEERMFAHLRHVQDHVLAAGQPRLGNRAERDRTGPSA